MFDYLIVGADFAGSVLAERLAVGSDKKVLICDRRPHIAGNAFDFYNDEGILIHKYGPHIFHTNSKDVFDYLSRFTEWRSYQHRVLAFVDGMLVPMPINLDTINKLYGLNLTAFEVEEFFEKLAEKREHIKTSEDVVVSKIGRELYEKFFRNYTRKQWGLDPSQLDASITARVPTRTNRDDRYFTDSYQAMPKHGYTKMFERMLDSPNIKIMLNCDYREIQNQIDFKEMIYTGPVDAFFNYRYGKLPYRSLEFKHETHNTEVFQSAPVVNYPNEQAFTRITEFKYLTGQEHRKTSIVYEFPRAEGDPYYPIPRKENADFYAKYKTLADARPDVHFVGRLATYKYYKYGSNRRAGSHDLRQNRRSQAKGSGGDCSSTTAESLRRVTVRQRRERGFAGKLKIYFLFYDGSNRDNYFGNSSRLVMKRLAEIYFAGALFKIKLNDYL
ncbi:MAG: UDP-galactopyranose mutase [Pyrinomonadaceae bacterium]